MSRKPDAAPKSYAKDKTTPDQYANTGNDGVYNPVDAESSVTLENLDRKRRRLLIAGAGGVGGLGVAAVGWSFVASMLPSARAKAAGAPVEVDYTKLGAGQLMTVEWRGKPVWIVNRTPEQLEALAADTARLSDPDSEASIQPEYAVNGDRSIKPEYLVVLGVCTHLGCSPTFRPDVAPADLGAQWDGGFFCPCHGSKFDLAGRVYAGVPAPTNLEIPPYKFTDTGTIVIGDDEGAQPA